MIYCFDIKHFKRERERCSELFVQHNVHSWFYSLKCCFLKLTLCSEKTWMFILAHQLHAQCCPSGVHVWILDQHLDVGTTFVILLCFIISCWSTVQIRSVPSLNQEQISISKITQALSAETLLDAANSSPKINQPFHPLLQ